MEFSPDTLANSIEKFNLSDKYLEDLAQKMATSAPKELARNIHKFKLSQSHLSRLAPLLFEKDSKTFTQNIVQFNLTMNEKKLFSDKIIHIKPSLLNAHIRQFKFPESDRIAYAKALLAITPNSIAYNIGNFELDNNQWISLLAQAKQEGHLSNKMLQNFSNSIKEYYEEPNLLELTFQITDQLLTESYDVPKIFNADTIRAAVRHSQPQLATANSSQHYPIQEKFESFFEKLNFQDRESPYYIHIDLTAHQDPDHTQNFEEKLQRRKELFFNKLKAITDDSSNTNQNDVFIVHQRHKPILQNALREIGEKLEALSVSNPYSFGAAMATLIAGFQTCETAQATSIKQVHQMLVHQQLPPDVSFEEKIKHLISDAKMKAYLQSSQNYGIGVHAISEAHRIIENVIGLPNPIPGFHDRVFHYSPEDRIHVLQSFFAVFTKNFLIDFISKHIKTEQDQKIASDLIENQLNSSSRNNKDDKTPTEHPEIRINGLDFLQWVSSMCHKKNLDPHEILKNEYNIDLGEYLDQPYTISKTTIERALFELGYLNPENDG